MQTERGKYLAQRNADFLVSYMAKLSAELKGDYETRDEASSRCLLRISNPCR
ncbi:metal-dependent phospho hydrolase [Salmonella enterica subsp. enterica]|uniref:Metal-dependent phospho hydrolase n=1 Tax=Salmonella enterica I TaxID=59201 RepID=A0A379WRD3_SALET|nr:metal-dependent phospho hydrolase [Salmonella enterica subsp. enterica]